jgi:hypothetical protein
MLKWLIGKRLATFERDFNYDMSYARDILAADPGALLRFMKVTGMASYRKGAPRDPCYAARIVGTVAEDCGPCTQLVVTMAEREGVPPSVIRAVLERDVAAMPDDVALAFHFAHAVLAHDPEADTLREQVLERWGSKGLVSLAFAVTSARIFPTLKYALGHGKACTRVSVAGVPTDVHKLVP